MPNKTFLSTHAFSIVLAASIAAGAVWTHAAGSATLIDPATHGRRWQFEANSAPFRPTDGIEAADDLSGAVIGFDRYACPSGWIEFDRTTRRVAKTRQSVEDVRIDVYPPAPPPAPESGSVGPTGPKRPRYGLLWCKRL